MVRSKEKTVKESTIIKYNNLLSRHILPALGKISFSEIDDEKMNSFIISLIINTDNTAKSISAKSVNDILSVVRSIRKYAVQSGRTVEFTIQNTSIKCQPKQLKAFSVNEQNILHKYLSEERSLSSIGILLCMYTGIRIGELCALRWEDFSRIEKTISINKTMQRLQAESEIAKTKIVITKPKCVLFILFVSTPWSEKITI